MKNFKTYSVLIFLAFAGISMLTSCDDEEKVKGDYVNGVYIINEGSYGNSNGSLSFYSYTDDSVYNDIFNKVNGRSLGDVVQSVAFSGDNAFIVVNNSNKVEVADKNTMEEKGVIENVTSPRYMVVKNNTGYITCWGDNSVKIVDMNTLSVTGSISTQGTGPDKMIIKDDKLYVINSGGYGTDSTVSIISLTNNSFVKKVVVSINPKDIVADNYGNIWVLTYGEEIYDDNWAVVGHTPSGLCKIDAGTDEVTGTAELFEDKHPMHLEIDKDGSTLYLGGGYSFEGIYKTTVEGTTITMEQILADYAYGFNYDNYSDVLFVALSGDFSAGGKLKRYKTDGTLLGTYTCGIGTSGAAFKSKK